MNFRTAAPMAAQGPRKGEPSSGSMRYGLRIQPARLVRGSSRRIMTMRFRPANIRVINRRASSWVVIGPAVRTSTLQAHQRERVPARPPVEVCVDARTVLAVKGTLRRYAPLTAPRRSGGTVTRRAAPAGTLHGPEGTERRRPARLLAEANRPDFKPAKPGGA
jgi:hypothetical protein